MTQAKGETMKILRFLILPITALSLFGWTQPQEDTVTPERRHPGHQMKVEYIPTAAEFKVGEPVAVELRITNVGETSFRFMRGGRQRGARDNQFAFNAQFGRRMLPDIGDPIHFGGIATFVQLEPGKTVEIRVDLDGWFSLNETGTYMLRGSYYMAFTEPDSESFSTIWEDYATSEFMIRIGDE
ncbi:MAG: hypothetical protein IID31_09105 [Planctomycetes bacterium]|nr:hypothetical protein [Planctomycetota bacterium]